MVGTRRIPFDRPPWTAQLFLPAVVSYSSPAPQSKGAAALIRLPFFLVIFRSPLSTRSSMPSTNSAPELSLVPLPSASRPLPLLPSLEPSFLSPNFPSWDSPLTSPSPLDPHLPDLPPLTANDPVAPRASIDFASYNQNLPDTSLFNTADAITSWDSPFTDAITSWDFPSTESPSFNSHSPDTSLSNADDVIVRGISEYMSWHLQLPRYVLRVGSFAYLHDLKQYLTFLADRALRDIEAEDIHVKAGRALSARKHKKGKVRPEELHLSDYVIKNVIHNAIKHDLRKSPTTMVHDLVAWEQYWGLRDIHSYNDFLQIFFHFKYFHDAISSDTCDAPGARPTRWEDSHWVIVYRACEDRRVHTVRPDTDELPCDADLREAINVLSSCAVVVSYSNGPLTVWQYRKMDNLQQLTNLAVPARPFPGVAETPVTIFRMEPRGTAVDVAADSQWMEDLYKQRKGPLEPGRDSDVSDAQLEMQRLYPGMNELGNDSTDSDSQWSEGLATPDVFGGDQTSPADWAERDAESEQRKKRRLSRR